jgi:methyl-accepting chemotaxis protein
MRLVKTAKMAANVVKPRARSETAVFATRPKAAPCGRTRAAATPRHEKASERAAAATEELASGLAEASAAAEQLRRSMEQIATGAEEAAGASQEQLGAIKSIVANLTTARNEAESSRRRTETIQIALAETALQITTYVRAIQKNAERQQASATIIAELERRARDIGEIIGTVSRISDQTNLLALNAAIEAARAGDHGRGFAVVAEEVRALAETSEKSSKDVQSLAQSIQTDVQGIVQSVTAAATTASSEAKTGAAVVENLRSVRHDMDQIAEGSRDTLSAASEAERAVSELQRGAEQVASAAEEQSAAAGEAQSAIQQQAQSLEQAQIAAHDLASVSEELRDGRAGASGVQQVGATAEELSATIQELSSAAAQITAAIEQINRGSQQQAASTQQASAALAQIEKNAVQARANAKVATERVQQMRAAVTQSWGRVDALLTGVTGAVGETRSGLAMIAGLDSLGRRIDKIVDGIALVSVQTSMLAVSGAVEAARAGDLGRGFSVVSNDIRNLAREAFESADRIKDMVRGIFDQITSVRRDLELVVGASEAEVEKNRSIVATLEDIDGDIAALVEANGAILRGTDAILAAVEESASGARQIAAAAEEAGAASREAATAANEQSRGAQDLAAAIGEIASLASELNKPNG